MEHDSEMQGGSTMPGPIAEALAAIGYIESRLALQSRVSIEELMSQAKAFAAKFVASGHAIELNIADGDIALSYGDREVVLAWSRLLAFYGDLVWLSQVSDAQRMADEIINQAWARTWDDDPATLACRMITGHYITQLGALVGEHLEVMYLHSLRRIVRNRGEDALLDSIITRHTGSTPDTYRYRDYVIKAVDVEEVDYGRSALITFTVVDERGRQQELCFYELACTSNIQEVDGDIWFENVDGTHWSIYSTPLRAEFCRLIEP